MSKTASCTFAGCGRPSRSGGLCWGHGTQKKRGQDLTPLQVHVRQTRTCTFPGCANSARALNLCSGHYRQEHAGEQLRPLLGTDKHDHECKRHAPSSTCYEVCKCRCDGCRRSRNRMVKRRKAGLTGLVDATPTQRRLRALAAIGWDCRTIAAKLGIGTRQVVQLRGDRRLVRTSTDTRVRALYEELSMMLPPDGIASRSGRTRAARDGWAPPLAWDDGMGPHGIDNPAATPVTGRPRKTRTAAEKIEELDMLAGSGNADEIARRLGYSGADSMATSLSRAGHTEAARKIRSARKAA